MIIDAFVFYNELEMLEKRLDYLSSHVDYFALVECNYTYSGMPKPMYFQENRNRYSKYLHRIIYHQYIIDPANYNFNVTVENLDFSTDHWRLEWEQRACITDVISTFAPEDIILYCDLDEMPNKHAFDRVAKELETNEVVALDQRFFYYNLNNEYADRWIGPIATKKKVFSYATPKQIRDHSVVTSSRIADGGWHMSYFFDEHMISKKIKSISHQEWNKEYWTDPARIKKCMEDGVDIFQRAGHPPLTKSSKDSFPTDFLDIFGKYYKE